MYNNSNTIGFDETLKWFEGIGSATLNKAGPKITLLLTK